MKKILMMLSLIGIVAGCTSTQGEFEEILVVECEPQYKLEDVKTVEKPLEDIFVFKNEEVAIKKEKDNLVLSMPAEVLFDFDSYEVKEGVKESITTLGKDLAENKDIKLKIIGHTDSIGTEQYNLNLSLERANSIKKYLVGKEVPADNISVEGYGEEKPVATNLTKEGRAKNRRVEFIISRDKVIF